MQHQLNCLKTKSSQLFPIKDKKVRISEGILELFCIVEIGIQTFENLGFYFALFSLPCFSAISLFAICFIVLTYLYLMDEWKTNTTWKSKFCDVETN